MNFVPGTTGRNQPAGTTTLSNSPRVTPDSQRITPFSRSKERILLNLSVERITGARDASPYESPVPRVIKLEVSCTNFFNSATVRKEYILALTTGYLPQLLTGLTLGI